MYRVVIEVDFLYENNPCFDYEDYCEASEMAKKIADQGYVAKLFFVEGNDGEE